MPFTQVPDKAAGDVFTAAMWNTFIANNINAGLVVQLADTVLGGTAASVVLSSIPQQFSHLRLVTYMRGDQAVTANAQYIQLNGDVGANYDSQRLSASAAVASASEALAATRVQYASIPCASAPANSFAASVVDFPYYSQEANHKAWVSQCSNKYGTTSGTLEQINFAGFWRSAAAITSITITPFANNFVAGSRVTLYGCP